MEIDPYRSTRNGCLVIATACAVAAIARAPAAEAGRPGPPEAVARLENTAARTVWRIDRPVINRPESRYPQIVFQPGDRVTISAGGCARRGGFPPPNGPAVPYLHGDNLYMGTIYIPGIVPGGVKGKIEKYVGTHDLAWDTHLPDMFLILGYEDNDFGDNNYNDIDDIDSGPCKGLGYAWVRIDIAHGAVPRPGGARVAADGKPMDLVWDALDDNGLPLDPRWKFERDHPGSHPDPVALCDLRTPGMPRCTTQDVTDDSTPNVAANAGCNLPTANLGEQFAGHKNWWAATYTGAVALTAGYSRYLGASLLVGWDADLDFAMVPKSATGLTAASIHDKGGAFSMEFDGEEVLFDRSHSASWWSRLYDVENDDRAKEMFNPGGLSASGSYTLPAGKPYDDSVVLGLVGLDCRHDCFAELHPVYAMAAHVDAAPVDRWAVFARNWGNEGSCGGQDHQLELTTITLRIPHKGATAVQVLPQTEMRASTATGTAWNFSPVIHNPGTENAYALITFDLPPPLRHAVIAGELVLAWTGGHPTGTLAIRPFHGDEDARPTRGDPATEAVIKKLPPAQQPAFRGSLPVPARTVVTLRPAATAIPQPWHHKHPRETHKAVSNQPRIDELARSSRQLCATLGGTVTGRPDACETARKP